MAFGTIAPLRSGIENARRFGRWLELRDVDLNVPRWLSLAGVIGFVAILMRQPVIGLIAVGMALLALGIRVWWDHCFRGFRYVRTLSRDRAFYGDDVVLELTVENAKPLPLTRLEVTETVSTKVEILNRVLERTDSPQERHLRSVFSLGMYERVHYRFHIATHNRGWHRFGPTTLVASDPLGLVARREQLQDITGLLVYPRVVPVSEVIVPARQPFGDFTPQQSLVEDPLRMAGVRPYVAGDSPRRIHWRASARTGTLQTRTFEPSASPIAALFLDTITFSYLWEGQNSKLLELAITTTASLASSLTSSRHQVGLYANAPLPGRARSIRIAPGRRPAQLNRMLEALAMLSPAFGERIERMVVEELPRLPWGSTVVIVTCRVSEGLQRSMLRLSRSSGAQRFVIVAIGAEPELLPELRKRVPVYHLGDELAWDELDVIALERRL